LTFGVLWEVFLCWYNPLSFVGVLHFFYDWVYIKLLLLVFQDKGHIEFIMSFKTLLPLLLLLPFAVFICKVKSLRIFPKIYLVILTIFIARITKVFIIFLLLKICLISISFSFAFPIIACQEKILVLFERIEIIFLAPFFIAAHLKGV